MQIIPRFTKPCFMAIALLGLSTPVLSAAADNAAVEDHTADFNVLTIDFTRLDALFANYTDPVHKLETAGYINLLKTRATQLGWKAPEGMSMGGTAGRGGGGGAYGRGGQAPSVQFDQVRYDELRYDINLQFQRLATFLGPLRTPPLPSPSERGLDIAIGELRPDPANAAEVKAALNILDQEIKRLEKRTNAMAVGSIAQESETTRLNRIKERRALLGKEFTKPRWDEMVGELNSE
jgi:hypothetical protein